MADNVRILTGLKWILLGIKLQVTGLRSVYRIPLLSILKTVGKVYS